MDVEGEENEGCDEVVLKFGDDTVFYFDIRVFTSVKIKLMHKRGTDGQIVLKFLDTQHHAGGFSLCFRCLSLMKTFHFGILHISLSDKLFLNLLCHVNDSRLFVCVCVKSPAVNRLHIQPHRNTFRMKHGLEVNNV